jgi:alpha-tubulin suppressor-like RCC1 family protein
MKLILLISIFSFTCFTQEEGTIYTSGFNNYGQLGSGNFQPRIHLENIQDFDWVKVVAGFECTLAIKSNGTLWAWGNNRISQLATKDIDNSTFPIQIGQDNDWTDVFSKNLHQIGIKKDGSLWFWGRSLDRYVYPDSYSHFPVLQDSSNYWIDVSIGNAYVLLKDKDNLIWYLDESCSIETGDSLKPFVYFKPKLLSSKNWKEFSTDGTLSVAIDENNKLYAKSKDHIHVFGKNNTDFSKEFIKISDKEWNYVEVENGSILAIDSKKNLWVWGLNAHGRLGVEDDFVYDEPYKVGDYKWNKTSSSYFTLAIREDNTLWGWGYNYQGQLGLGDTLYSYLPRLIDSTKKWIDISSGLYHSMTLAKNETTSVQEENSKYKVINTDNLFKIDSQFPINYFLFDLDGNLLENNENSILSIIKSQLTIGTYMIRFELDGMTFTEKFVVSK